MNRKQQRNPATLYNVLLDSDVKSLAVDSEGKIKTALAFVEGRDLAYVFKREWVQRNESHKPQKNGWYVVEDFLGNKGITSWSVNVATDTELESVAKSNGYDVLYPYVYIISQKERLSQRINFVKIGCSFNPKERLKTLQTGNPYKLELHATFKTSNTRGDIASMYSKERLVHKALAKFGGPYSTGPLTETMNDHSEWFDVVGDNLKEIYDTVEGIANVDACKGLQSTSQSQKRVRCDASDDSDF